MERRWLFLARSYEFTERLGDFSDEAKRNTDKLPEALAPASIGACRYRA